MTETEQDKCSFPSVSMPVCIIVAGLWVLEGQTDRQITSLPAVRGKRRNRPLSSSEDVVSIPLKPENQKLLD